MASPRNASSGRKQKGTVGGAAATADEIRRSPPTPSNPPPLSLFLIRLGFVNDFLRLSIELSSGFPGIIGFYWILADVLAQSRLTFTSNLGYLK